MALGATTFMRLEWIEGINDNTIFITETGRGKSQSVKPAMQAGATLASHLIQLDAKDGKIDSTYNDLWGRVLRLDVATGKIESALEGGGDLDPNYNPFNSSESNGNGHSAYQKPNASGWENLFPPSEDEWKEQEELPLEGESGQARSKLLYQMDEKYILTHLKSGMLAIHQHH